MTAACRDRVTGVWGQQAHERNQGNTDLKDMQTSSKKVEETSRTLRKKKEKKTIFANIIGHRSTPHRKQRERDLLDGRLP